MYSSYIRQAFIFYQSSSPVGHITNAYRARRQHDLLFITWRQESIRPHPVLDATVKALKAQIFPRILPLTSY